MGSLTRQDQMKTSGNHSGIICPPPGLGSTDSAQRNLPGCASDLAAVSAPHLPGPLPEILMHGVWGDVWKSVFLKSFPSDCDMWQGVKPPLRGVTAPCFWAKCPKIKRNSHLSGGLGRRIPSTGLFKHPPLLPKSGLPALTSALTGTWASCFLVA